MATDPGPRQVDRRKVFVIHGRNEDARRGLFEFLRALGLDPIEWSAAIELTGQGSPYIGNVLDTAFAAAQAVVVLQTPDDVAYLHESLTEVGDPECEPQMQPRPNVLFEAGIAMGRHPERTIIVELGKIKSFSDIHGRHVVRLDNSVAKRQELATRLSTAECEVRLIGTDWHTAGDLTPPPPVGGGLPLGRKAPSSRASGHPRLDARLQKFSGNTLDQVIVTNHGPGDVLELDADIESDEIRAWGMDGFPVPLVPAGKSVPALRVATRGKSYFTVTVTGKTVDGTPLRQEVFIGGV